MSDWFNDISEEAIETMKFLGDFGPTSNKGDAQLKGYMHDEYGSACKEYLDSNDLRNMAKHFIEVADWLDRRALEE